MLVYLAVENFLCFDKRVELHLDSSPITLLIGGTSCGKSSLLKALACVRNLVLGGSRPGQPLPVSPSVFNASSASRFELEIQQAGTRFLYGFSASAQQIEEEWLAVRAKDGSLRPLFARKKTAQPPVAIELFGELADDRQRLELIAYGTRPEQLFLCEGLRRGVRNFVPVGTWLRDRLQMILPEAKIVGLAARAAREPAFASFLGQLLSDSNTGVSAVEVEREAVDPSVLESEEEQRELLNALTRFPDAFAETPEGEIIAERDGQIVDLYRVRLQFFAQHADGRKAELPANELADGTLRLLHLAPMLYSASGAASGTAETSAQVFFLDDLTRSLEPRLVSAVVQRFLKNTQPTKKAEWRDEDPQLIATTHDRLLIESGLLAPSQAYRLERSEQGIIVLGCS